MEKDTRGKRSQKIGKHGIKWKAGKKRKKKIHRENGYRPRPQKSRGEGQKEPARSARNRLQPYKARKKLWLILSKKKKKRGLTQTGRKAAIW